MKSLDYPEDYAGDVVSLDSAERKIRELGDELEVIRDGLALMEGDHTREWLYQAYKSNIGHMIKKLWRGE